MAGGNLFYRAASACGNLFCFWDRKDHGDRGRISKYAHFCESGCHGMDVPDRVWRIFHGHLSVMQADGYGKTKGRIGDLGYDGKCKREYFTSHAG